MTKDDLRQTPFVLLDDSRPDHRAGRSLLFKDPVAIIRADHVSEIPEAMRKIDEAAKAGLYLAGYVAYEAAQYFEPKLAGMMQAPSVPYIWMMVCETRQVLNRHQVDDLLYQSERGNSRFCKLDFHQKPDEASWFADAFDRVQKHINAGDVYQINLTFARDVELTGDPLAYYRALRMVQPVAYGAYLHMESGEQILSLSPELFVARDGEKLTAKPMKGTAPRGLDINEDAHIAQTLASDEKSQAENLMIVDLLRNDLSRLAARGSVKVDSLFEVERYPTVMQMISTVQATAKDDLTPSGLLAGLFPCGSVTGAPKLRAMEVIAELERGPRGVYCGAIGHFSPKDWGSSGKESGPGGAVDWAFNVPIRTMTFSTPDEDTNKHQGRLHVGAGLVADSVGADEYQECLLKAQFASKALTAQPAPSLIETMRVHEGKPERREAHLARLGQSAAYYDYPFDSDAISRQLQAHVSELSLDTDWRLRLLLGPDGALTTQSQPIAPNMPQADGATAKPRVKLANVAITPSVQRRHKTTDRALYDHAFKAALKDGLFDVLFLNEAGRVAEGAITNLFIIEGDSWITPPLSEGALPGIMRAELIQKHAAKEETIDLERLKSADQVVLSNSVRGAVPVNVDLESLLIVTF